MSHLTFVFILFLILISPIVVYFLRYMDTCAYIDATRQKLKKHKTNKDYGQEEKED